MSPFTNKLPATRGLMMVLVLLLGVYVHNVSMIQGVAAQDAAPKKAFKMPEIPLSEEQLKLKANPKVAAALEQAAKELQESLKKHLAKKKLEEAAAKAAEGGDKELPEAEL